MTSKTLQQLSDIEDIRQLTINYARATDALGSNDEGRAAEGRALYHRTFTADAKVQAGDSDTLTGPDEWADFVRVALKDYSSTQHLVGTIDIVLGEGANADTATMSTYLSATHEHAPGGNLWIVLGTYEDECRRTPEGWRISRRTLLFTSDEMREHA